ncbi:MAG: MarR family transcriptional regulator [bacterium]|nr:MarR family transcriptional regulator [bacterium]
MKSRKKIIEHLMQDLYAMRRNLAVGFSATKKRSITPSQGCVLRYIAKNEQINVKAIAQKLDISSSAVTQLIDGLVEKGYVSRSNHSEDRRVVTVCLTAKANKLFEEFKAQGLKKMTILFDVLSDDELARYAELHAKIVAGIAQKKDNPSSKK